MKLIISLLISTYSIGINAEFKELPIFKCEVEVSSGSFHSFIQPRNGEHITIDLNAPNTIVSQEVIKFSGRGYISLHPQAAILNTDVIPRGSHDQGGWVVSNKNPNREFTINIIKTDGRWLGWIIDQDLPKPAPMSLASLNCLML